MDEIAHYNQNRWAALGRARAIFTRPWLDLTPEQARYWVHSDGVAGQAGMDEIAGKQVLCLASGGGQQSAAFGLLGARVTVLDLSEAQLERDRETAAHYGLAEQTEQAD